MLKLTYHAMFLKKRKKLWNNDIQFIMHIFWSNYYNHSR